MVELVINVSNIISPLCYSLIRLEPYTSCSFNCIYCYTQWYWDRSSRPSVRVRAIKEFLSIAKKIYTKSLKPIPARLSTLVDPYQPVEEYKRASLRIMKIALKYSYPLIINTKSTLITKDPWRKILVKLTDENLALVQISITSLDDNIARKLEPLAPSSTHRLKVAKELSSEGIPVILRLSPYIPRVSIGNLDYEDVAGFFKDLGVKHVIVEGIRFTRPELDYILNTVGVRDLELESYSLRVIEGGRPLYKPSRLALYGEYSMLSRELAKHNISFATCKEGLFSLHTSSDCCGMYLLKNYALRITLYEFYKEALKNPIDVDKIGEVMDKLCSSGYLCSNNMDEYPKRIRKPFRNHEKKLLRILRSREHLTHVTPEMDIVDNKIVVRVLG